MRLTDLEPHWCIDDPKGEERAGMGISFLCPHCKATGYRLAVFFANPIDGGAPSNTPRKNAAGKVCAPTLWQRAGTTFDDLTLSPSIDASKFGHWHGHITNGDVV